VKYYSVFSSVVMVGALAMASFNLTAEEEDRSAVLERIKPIGSVAITGQAAPASDQPAAPAAAEEKKAEPAPAAAAAEQAVAAAPADGASAGEGVYKKACFVCHDMGVAGAPKIGDKENWAPRIAKGMDALIASSINGTTKGMPPRGTCAACSDDELKAAVEYMTNKSQ
jgi:cytochrome c5